MNTKMKFFATIALIVAVASAGVIKPSGNYGAEIQAVIAAIESPHTDPATAMMLQQQLAELLGIAPPSPAIVDPVSPVVVVDEAISPVQVVDEVISPVNVADEAAPVIPVGPAHDAVAPIQPLPASSPLVQVILNINAPSGAVDVSPVAPVITPEIIQPVDPVIVTDEADNIVEVPDVAVLPPLPVAPVEPVLVVDPVFPAPVSPVIISEPTLPVVQPPVEPVIIGEPTLPVAPAVTLPETLN